MAAILFGRRNTEAVVVGVAYLGTAKTGQVVHRLLTFPGQQLGGLWRATAQCGFRPRAARGGVGTYRWVGVADAADQVTCPNCLAGHLARR